MMTKEQAQAAAKEIASRVVLEHVVEDANQKGRRPYRITAAFARAVVDHAAADLIARIYGMTGDGNEPPTSVAG